MIIGVGVDLVAISRMGNAIHTPGFLERVFTEFELSYYENSGKRKETLAGIFAVKEAMAKALGTGIGAVGCRSVEVLHTEQGAPYVALHDTALDRMVAIGGKKIFVSISHEGDMAMAQVVLEG